MKDSDTSYQVVVGGSSDDLFIDGVGVPVEVIPFLDVSGQPLSNKYARGVTDELVHELMQSEGCRVVSANSISHLGAQSSDVPSLARKLGVQIVFEGTVRGRVLPPDSRPDLCSPLEAGTDTASACRMDGQRYGIDEACGRNRDGLLH
jgi:hypothetical protein